MVNRNTGLNGLYGSGGSLGYPPNLTIENILDTTVNLTYRIPINNNSRYLIYGIEKDLAIPRNGSALLVEFEPLKLGGQLQCLMTVDRDSHTGYTGSVYVNGVRIINRAITESATAVVSLKNPMANDFPTFGTNNGLLGNLDIGDVIRVEVRTSSGSARTRKCLFALVGNIDFIPKEVEVIGKT